MDITKKKDEAAAKVKSELRANIKKFRDMMQQNPQILLWLSPNDGSPSFKCGRFRDLCQSSFQDIYLDKSHPELVIIIKDKQSDIELYGLSRNLFITSDSIQVGTDDRMNARRAHALLTN